MTKKAPTPKALPHDPETEKSLLGGLLVDGTQVAEVRSYLEPEDFHRAQNQNLFRTMLEMVDAGGVLPDVVTVLDVLTSSNRLESCGGLSYVLALPGMCPSVSSVPNYARLVRRHAVRRKMHLAAQQVLDRLDQGDPSDDVLADTQRAFLSIDASRGDESGYRTWEQIADEAMDEVRESIDHPERATGLATGIVDFDRMTTGLHRTDLVILAARPGVGKSALAMNIAEHVAGRGVGVGVVSMEMQGTQLAKRSLAGEARIDNLKLRSGEVDNDEARRLVYAHENIRRLPIWVDQTGGQSVAMIVSRIRALKAKHPTIGLLVVDYLQLAEGGGGRRQENREQEIAAISRGLKLVAKELDIVVLALAQLNRSLEARSNKRPMLADLRNSGSIEQDADLVLFIYRDDMYNEDSPDKGLAELIVAKQRHGPQGTVKVAFLGPYQRFANLTSDYQGPAPAHQAQDPVSKKYRNRKDFGEDEDIPT